MQLARPAIAADPRRFGRARRAMAVAAPAPAAGGLSDDLRLFATTFLAGFLFVSVYLA